MKTQKFLVAICLAAAFLAAGCHSNKKTAKSPVPGEEAVGALPFDDFKTDDKYFRAVGVALSPDMNVAKKIAVQNAKSEIAGSMKALFDEVSSQYIKQHDVNALPDLVQKFEGMNQSVVSETLTGITVKNSRFFRVNATGDFRCYVAVEMPKENIKGGLDKRLSQEAKDRIDFDEFQYREIFDEALKEYKDR